MKYQKALYWFTNDLRLADNTLLATMANEAETACFVYVIDSQEFSDPIFQGNGVGIHRQRFIYDGLQDLSEQLSQHGHQLMVLKGEPVTTLIELSVGLDIDAIYVAHQTGLNEIGQVSRLKAKLSNVHVEQVQQHLLFDLTESLEPHKTLNSFSAFRRFIESGEFEVDKEHNLNKVLPYNLLDGLKIEQVSRFYNSIDLKLSVREQPYIAGGERAAQKHLTQYFNSDLPSSYKETRNALDDWQSSTKLSPYLASGNLSVKHVWHQLIQYESRFGRNDSTYWISFELLWREFFHYLALDSGANLFKFSGGQERGPLTSFYPERFKKWSVGNTPYPIVNACMKKLNATGYMSNRGRQLVASCLVNELALDWRFGAAYFQQQLIDYDVASNWGNWQYIAGVGVDPRGGRHFNLDKQTQYYDADGEFVGKWCNDKAEPLDTADMADWPIVENV